ncbi:Serine/threonine-protein kinase HT1 [Tetrabaena socialis]|uniref:Serine/threonine-protein kinase HT1 n=1 Tax=Tetrabaena socialis TaxID=47790 RepID=A0A2J7ZZH4_9CHLO|nr:Serine/threonine-protein kinase HT1 [Tetrabaena socialis]|eukprot:PNH05671.1 Serine/threonine-protein kinase HT1 [Tetrabaena socialis]
MCSTPACFGCFGWLLGHSQSRQTDSCGETGVRSPPAGRRSIDDTLVDPLARIKEAAARTASHASAAAQPAAAQQHPPRLGQQGRVDCCSAQPPARAATPLEVQLDLQAPTSRDSSLSGGQGGCGSGPWLPLPPAAGGCTTPPVSSRASGRSGSSWRSRVELASLAGLPSASGLRDGRAHPAAAAEPSAGGRLRAEAVLELSQRAGRLDLAAAVLQVSGLELVSHHSASGSLVYCGLADGRRVCVKYATAAAASAQGIAALATEGVLSRMLVHPNIIKTYGWAINRLSVEDFLPDMPARPAAAVRRRQCRAKREPLSSPSSPSSPSSSAAAAAAAAAAAPAGFKRGSPRAQEGQPQPHPPTAAAAGPPGPSDHWEPAAGPERRPAARSCAPALDAFQQTSEGPPYATAQPPVPSAAQPAGRLPAPLAVPCQDGWAKLQGGLRRLGAQPGGYLTRIVMEQADRGTLLEAIRAGEFVTTAYGGPSLPSAIRAVLLTALDIAHGMQELHRHCVIHGDLTPSNVLLQADPQDPRGCVAKVADFGLARIAPCGRLDNGDVFGAVRFMAPEVVAGSSFLASDVYSYGVVLRQMISGQEPWAGLRHMQVLVGVMQGDLRLDVPAGTHPPLAALLERCLAHDHTARPAFGAVVAELQAMLAELGSRQAAARLGSTAAPSPFANGPPPPTPRATAAATAPTSTTATRAAASASAPASACDGCGPLLDTAESFSPWDGTAAVAAAAAVACEAGVAAGAAPPRAPTSGLMPPLLLLPPTRAPPPAKSEPASSEACVSAGHSAFASHAQLLSPQGSLRATSSGADCASGSSATALSRALASGMLCSAALVVSSSIQTAGSGGWRLDRIVGLNGSADQVTSGSAAGDPSLLMRVRSSSGTGAITARGSSADALGAIWTRPTWGPGGEVGAPAGPRWVRSRSGGSALGARTPAGHSKAAAFTLSPLARAATTVRSCSSSSGTPDPWTGGGSCRPSFLQLLQTDGAERQQARQAPPSGPSRPTSSSDTACCLALSPRPLAPSPEAAAAGGSTAAATPEPPAMAAAAAVEGPAAATGAAVQRGREAPPVVRPSSGHASKVRRRSAGAVAAPAVPLLPIHEELVLWLGGEVDRAAAAAGSSGASENGGAQPRGEADAS